MFNLIGNELSDSFEESIKEIGTAAIDDVEEILNNPLIDVIPVIRYLVKGYKGVQGFRERLLAKKLLKFLTNISEISQQEREEFISRLNEDQKYKERVYNNLIIIIDKIEDEEKIDILSNLFKAFVTENMSGSDFLRAIKVTESVFIEDLKYFGYYYDYEDKANQSSYFLDFDKTLSMQTFSSQGLVKVTLEDNKHNMQYTGGKELKFFNKTSISEFGRIFLEHGLNVKY